MKLERKSEVSIHIDTQYRYTFHPMFEGKTGLIEIEVWDNPKWSKGRWLRIYFGHIDPIEKALHLYEDNLTPKP
jgi:hypothetical protein